jgi:hypothetical protein
MESHPDMTRWTDEFLDPMRRLGDPLADQTTEALFQQHKITMANGLLRDATTNGSPLPDGVPEVLKDYFAQSAHLPKWADPEVIERGERLFSRYGPQVIVVYHCYSLPFCYASRRGVQVLQRTSRLAKNPQRRILETAQMIVDVMAPGGLTRPDCHGVRTAQKVRLMHSAVRRLILQQGAWDQADLGLPINQEDMAGTLNAFAWITLDGLTRLGVDFTPDELEAYLHCWNVVGHLLGIREELLPQTFDDGRDLAEALDRRHFETCAEGREMQAALLQMMEYQIPGDVFDGIPATLTRRLLGDRVSDLLDVPPSDWTKVIFKPLRFLSMLSDTSGDSSWALAKLSEVFGRQLLNAIIWANRGKDRPRFNIPAELVQTWQLNWVA